MMKKVQAVLSNIGALVFLLVLGLGLVLFFSNYLPNEELTAQDPDTKPTLTPVIEKPTLTPTSEEKVTSTPTTAPDEPQDDLPEPTWTPAVVHPVGTPPPLPSPPPTPTPTPINSKENVIATLHSLASDLAISPDSKTLALIIHHAVPKGNFLHQLGVIDLESQKLEKFDIYGQHPLWSPDGKSILFWDQKDDQVDIKIIDVNSKEQKTLTNLAWDEFLNTYWATSNAVDIIHPERIDRLDLTGRVTDQ